MTPNATIDSAFEGDPPTPDEWRRMAIGMATQLGASLGHEPGATSTIAALRAALNITREHPMPLPTLDA